VETGAIVALMTERNQANTTMSDDKESPDKDGTIEYPETNDSSQMGRTAREAVNRMTNEEVDVRVEAAMARIYGGRSAQRAPGA
jgi:hypothetical protein